METAHPIDKQLLKGLVESGSVIDSVCVLLHQVSRVTHSWQHACGYYYAYSTIQEPEVSGIKDYVQIPCKQQDWNLTLHLLSPCPDIETLLYTKQLNLLGSKCAWNGFPLFLCCLFVFRFLQYEKDFKDLSSPSCYSFLSIFPKMIFQENSRGKV